MNKKKTNATGCKHCGSLHSKPGINEKGEKVYWVAVFKNSTDFAILTSNLKYRFMSSSSEEFPASRTDIYDFYCIECFEKLYEEACKKNEDTEGEEWKNGK